MTEHKPFDEAAHIDALNALTVRVVRDRQRGRRTPDEVVRQVDVGTVRMLASRAAAARRLGHSFDQMAAGCSSPEKAATYSRLAATQRARADRTQRSSDHLLASLPEPWAVRAAQHLAADSVARRAEEATP